GCDPARGTRGHCWASQQWHPGWAVGRKRDVLKLILIELMRAAMIRRTALAHSATASAFSKGERTMSIGLSGLARATLVVAVILLTSARSWAIYDVLGPSKDEWGLKYDVRVNDAGGETVTVVFTLADEGRLKPLTTIELYAFNPQTDEQGGHSY